jgi:hypothetical protein
MGRNQNSDNEYWPEYERIGKNFVGSADEIDDLVDDLPRHRNKKKKQMKMRRFEDGNQ